MQVVVVDPDGARRALATAGNLFPAQYDMFPSRRAAALHRSSVPGMASPDRGDGRLRRMHAVFLVRNELQAHHVNGLRCLTQIAAAGVL
jgi:hypothetical protein